MPADERLAMLHEAQALIEPFKLEMDAPLLDQLIKFKVLRQPQPATDI